MGMMAVKHPVTGKPALGVSPLVDQQGLWLGEFAAQMQEKQAEFGILIADTWLSEQDGISADSAQDRSEALLIAAGGPDFQGVVIHPFTREGRTIRWGEPVSRVANPRLQAAIEENMLVPFRNAFGVEEEELER